jgi:hypothetical protein
MAVAFALLLGTTSITAAAPVSSRPAAPPIDETSTDSPGSFAVQPSGKAGPGGRDFFIYTLKVGELYGDTVAISNLGTEPATFVIYATDAQNTTDGSFSLMREEESPTGVGTWVELGATQWTVEPGTFVNIPFSISVPDDAAAGDHVGAIVAQKIDDPDNPDDGIGLDVRVRVGARLYVRVDGPVNPSLAIDRFDVIYDAPATPFGTRNAKIVYTLTNTGDIRLAPIANLELAGLFGLGSSSLPERQIPELLPGGSIEIAETVQDVRPWVRLAAELEVRADEAAVVVTASVTHWAVPWPSVIALGAVVLALVIWRLVARRRKRVTT